MPFAARQTSPRRGADGRDPRKAVDPRLARNAAGLATLLGGTLAMASYFAAGLWSLGDWARGLLALIPFAWVAGKSRLYRHVDRILSGGSPPPSRLEGTLHRISCAVVTASCLGVLVFAAERLWGKSPPWEIWASLGFTLAMPVVVWRWLRTAEELFLGLFLMFQAVLLLAGRPSQLGSLLQIPIVAAMAMLLGARQHHEFVQSMRDPEDSGTGVDGI